MHPDQQYITALMNNEVALIEEIYKRFSDKIKWMVLKNNGDENDAADLFQEALLSIYHKAKTQNFVLTCPLEAFLYIICRSRWMNELNKRKNSNVTFDDQMGYNLKDDSFQQATECVQQHERRELLEEKIKELGEGCQHLLRLSWSGKAMNEVAGALKVTYGYVRKKKSECMAKLMRLVQQSPKYNSLKW